MLEGSMMPCSSSALSVLSSPWKIAHGDHLLHQKPLISVFHIASDRFLRIVQRSPFDSQSSRTLLGLGRLLLRECSRSSPSDSDRWEISAVPGIYGIVKKRKVVEHVVLLKAKEDISEEDEKAMLDFLYTLQYHVSGILAMSLGRVTCSNAADSFTHGICMRFQRKEDLAKFYQSPFYKSVLEEHVIPHCHGFLSVDYESEVEDDILTIFRRGEDFEYGVEFVLLLSFFKNAPAEDVEDAFRALLAITESFSSLIVQATQGLNFNIKDTEYTHGTMIRFPSYEALQAFCGSFEYMDMWIKKFKPVTESCECILWSKAFYHAGELYTVQYPITAGKSAGGGCWLEMSQFLRCIQEPVNLEDRELDHVDG